MALVTSHFTLDKARKTRDFSVSTLRERADFYGRESVGLRSVQA